VAIKAPTEEHPLRRVFLDAIVWADGTSDRSVQTTIGPSELGNACMRRLAYSLDGTVPVNTTADPWFAILGTAFHAWMATALDRYQRDVLGRDPLTNPRWLLEQQVWTGDPNCPSGHSDCYDLDFETVVDWKVVGPTTMKKVRASGPAEYYRIQGHTYGKGWKRAGRDVRQVMIVFLPRNAPLRETFVWAEAFDESVADRALARLAAIGKARSLVPTHSLPTAAECTWCPYYRPHRASDGAGCTGYEGGGRAF
jgi:hypothetical protein